MIERVIKFCFALLLIVPISAIVLGQTIGPPPSSGGSGTPAGSNTQIQYNNSGVFGASANLTYNGTSLFIKSAGAAQTMVGDGGGTPQWSMINGFGATTPSGVYLATNTPSATPIGIYVDNNNTPLLINTGAGNGLIGFASDVRGFSTPDVGIGRNAAATLEVDNGTAGTLGTIAVAHVTATSLANSATTSAVCYNTSTGVFTYDGTIGTCNTSDARLKDIDGPIDGALQKVLAVHGIYFHYKDPKAQAEGRQIGVTAQNVEMVFPELVATDGNGIESVDYQKMIAPIIEAMREQQKEIDSLKREIAAHKTVRASLR